MTDKPMRFFVAEIIREKDPDPLQAGGALQQRSCGRDFQRRPNQRRQAIAPHRSHHSSGTRLTKSHSDRCGRQHDQAPGHRCTERPGDLPSRRRCSWNCASKWTRTGATTSASSSNTAISMAESPALEALTRVAFPNAKVNLGLQVRNRRKDGYHNIEVCFCPWWRHLRIGGARSRDTHAISTWLAIPGAPKTTSSSRTCLLVQKIDLPPVRFHLIKAIPMGAGLGGGSADGAFALSCSTSTSNWALVMSSWRHSPRNWVRIVRFFIRKPAPTSRAGASTFAPFNSNLEGWWIALFTLGYTSHCTRLSMGHPQ